jgi:hypothetical protein
MPRVALTNSLPLGKTSGCLYTPFVKDQHFHMASSFIVSTTTEDLFMRYTSQDLAGILGYWA